MHIRSKIRHACIYARLVLIFTAFRSMTSHFQDTRWPKVRNNPEWTWILNRHENPVYVKYLPVRPHFCLRLAVFWKIANALEFPRKTLNTSQKVSCVYIQVSQSASWIWQWFHQRITCINGCIQLYRLSQCRKIVKTQINSVTTCWFSGKDSGNGGYKWETNFYCKLVGTIDRKSFCRFSEPGICVEVSKLL